MLGRHLAPNHEISWWGYREKVIRIHHRGTMNVCTKFHINRSCKCISVWPSGEPTNPEILRAASVAKNVPLGLSKIAPEVITNQMCRVLYHFTCLKLSQVRRKLLITVDRTVYAFDDENHMKSA